MSFVPQWREQLREQPWWPLLLPVTKKKSFSLFLSRLGQTANQTKETSFQTQPLDSRNVCGLWWLCHMYFYHEHICRHTLHRSTQRYTHTHTHHTLHIQWYTLTRRHLIHIGNMINKQPQESDGLVHPPSTHTVTHTQHTLLNRYTWAINTLHTYSAHTTYDILTDGYIVSVLVILGFLWLCCSAIWKGDNL